MADSAFDTFFRTAQADYLPAAVPVATSGGELTGIMTTRFDVQRNREALEFASSDDPHQRALCAVYACRAARDGVERHPELDLHAT
jgi:hypothetical protein